MEDIYYQYNPWWEGKPFDSGILRQGYIDQIGKSLDRKQIDVIVGSRRVGKTTFLKQLIKKWLEGDVKAKNIFYLALDNPRIVKTPISEHLKEFRKIFMHSRNDKIYLCFDEIQDSPNWEAELKSIYDSENVKIVCTGSTSSLIKREVGKLTGRQIITKIYPLVFKEYLIFKNNIPSKAEDYKYEKLLEEYLETGGYPENVLKPSEEYMANLIDDIIAKDITRLHRINKPDALKELLTILSDSVGTRTSFNKISKVLGITLDTVKEYIGYLEEAFLVKPLKKWSASRMDRIYSQKKIYLYDTGVKAALTGKGDLGFKVENAVFLELSKRHANIGYYAESEKELDFAYGAAKAPSALEVKYDSKIDWKDKRFAGIRLFTNRYAGVKELTVVSKSVSAKIREGALAINVIPAWKFLG